MNGFLHDIARQIVEKHGTDLRRIAIVLPGKRAGLFLKKELYHVIGTSYFSPQIWTLPDLIKTLANTHTLSQTEQLLMLYKTYLRIPSDAHEPFEIFSTWAPQALQDFADVEQSLVQPDSLFRDLRDIKEIENWSFNQNPLSVSQNDYLEFWNRLGPLFSAFQKIQHEKGKYTYARLCHILSKDVVLQKIPNDISNIWICGLSGLSIAEKKIIDQLKEGKIATLRWDVDHYYLDNKQHEAGDFLRKHTSINDRMTGNFFEEIPKTIRVYQSSTGYGQALIAAELIEKIPTDQIEETAIIINDSSLLLPLLQNLPDKGHAVNIALGLSLKNTPVMNLIRSLAVLEHHRASKKDKGIYFRFLLKVIEQPALKSLMGTSARQIRKTIAKNRWIYFQDKNIEQLVHDFPELGFLKNFLVQSFEDYNIWLDALSQMLELFLNQETSDAFDSECIIRMQELLFEMKLMLQELPELNQIKSLQVILQHLISKESITFKGEPLEGLQILNMVETRALDFSNILFIGANEDQFPGNLMDQSLIPFDLRAFYKLPLVFDKEISYGYTFYRAIQRAKNVSFVTSAITSDFKGSEQSRYITQLELELCQLYPQNKIEHIRVESFKDAHPAIIQAVNDTFSKERIQQILASGLSPSAINKYLQCPLDFYYRYILQLGEEEGIEEGIDHALFGSVVHETLEVFFKPFVSSFPSLEELEEFRNHAEDYLLPVFKKYFSEDDLQFGENKLQVSLALQMLHQIITFEIEALKKRAEKNESLVIIALEENLKSEIPTEVSGLPFPIVLKGKTDRIDLLDDTLRILDYKTGRVKENELSILNSKTGEINTGGKVIQLLMYMHMASKHPLGNNIIRPAIFSMKNYKSGWMELDTGDNDLSQSEVLNLFEKKISEIVRDMLECSSFEHKTGSLYCEYCNR